MSQSPSILDLGMKANRTFFCRYQKASRGGGCIHDYFLHCSKISRSLAQTLVTMSLLRGGMNVM